VRIAVFSPFANIWEHSYPEALVASGLAERGWDVTYVTCTEEFQTRCVAMEAAGLNHATPLAQRQSVCRACHKRRDLLTSTFDFASRTLNSLVSAIEKREIENLLSTVTPDNWKIFSVDGEPLGRYAAYELWVGNKVSSDNIPAELWGYYLDDLRSTLIAYYAGKNLTTTTKFDAVLFYNEHYSVNHAFSAAVEKNGVPAYSIHGGWHVVHRGESLSMMRSGYIMSNVYESTTWQSALNTPISPDDVDRVASHLEGLWAANSAFAYSSALEGRSASSVRDQFGIDPTKKVLLATMSSLDEILGMQVIGAAPETHNQTKLFPDQFQWIECLTSFAASNPDVHIILRLHPRMFPNKREAKMAPVVEHIMALQSSIPSNVTLNVPDDNVSLYDLVQIVDVLLNYSSTVGSELLAMGVPVVVPWSSYFHAYPIELNRTGRTLSEYETAIRTAIDEGWSIENARKAFRWYAFLFGRIAVDLSESVSSKPNAMRPKKPGLRLRLWKFATWVALQYGPMVRERLALRRRSLPPGAIDIFNDTLGHRLDSVSESHLWPKSKSTQCVETAALEDFFRNLVDNQWSEVTESDSLAGRVRADVPPAPPK